MLSLLHAHSDKAHGPERPAPKLRPAPKQVLLDAGYKFLDVRTEMQRSGTKIKFSATIPYMRSTLHYDERSGEMVRAGRAAGICGRAGLAPASWGA